MMRIAPPGYSTKIIADSIAPSGKRLTTWELTYPRMVHAELMTHRLFSRNSASSRAIPVEKMLARIEETPAMPVYWGKNQAGMQAAEELDAESKGLAMLEWLAARTDAVRRSRNLLALGLHKQIANRVTEPWMYITVIVSSTELENWFRLRDHKDAQPEIAWVAHDMRVKFEISKPVELAEGAWHLPYIFEQDREEMRIEVPAAHVDAQLCKVATGRLARVSYLTHDGKRDLIEDIALHDKLIGPGHWSPFEHVAQAMTREAWMNRMQELIWKCDEAGELFDASMIGNFSGWLQYRKTFPPANEMRRKFKWGG